MTSKKKKIAPLEPPKTTGKSAGRSGVSGLTGGSSAKKDEIEKVSPLTPEGQKRVDARLKKSRADSIKYEDPGFRRIPSPLTQAVKNMKKGGRVRMDGTAKPR
mgnify:CR=1 FL=1|tara:strand:- start:15 stop:323 length:309 start_codon:yes stop_codon:yes gene_type:complete